MDNNDFGFKAENLERRRIRRGAAISCYRAKLDVFQAGLHLLLLLVVQVLDVPCHCLPFGHLISMKATKPGSSTIIVDLVWDNKSQVLE